MRRLYFLLGLIVFVQIPSSVFGQQQETPQPAVPPAATIPGAPGTDDRYQFDDGIGKEVNVQLTRTATGVRLQWPRVASAEWDTCLLAIKSLGAEAQPWVEISANGVRIQQYLDPNALGLRWLNLSAFQGLLSDESVVEIVAHAVTIEPGAATLRLFANKLNLKEKILILAPHPDDAEIAAFGLYADRNATIITVTSGNAGDMNYRANVSDPAEHYLLKGYLRAVDSVTVPWQGRIPPDQTFNLGYFDARLKEMYQTPDQNIPELYGPNENVAPYRRANLSKLLSNGSRTNRWSHLIDDLEEILSKVKPSIIVMPHPWLDSHLDHQYASVALVQALDKWRENTTFLLYTNHASANRYPFGPSGSVMSLPPWSTSDILLQGIYSHPLNANLQLRKLFALESNHDLRLSPEEQDTCDVPGLLLRPDYPRIPEVDYLRRGTHANELFYVYDSDGVKQVIRSFFQYPTESPTK